MVKATHGPAEHLSKTFGFCIGAGGLCYDNGGLKDQPLRPATYVVLPKTFTRRLRHGAVKPHGIHVSTRVLSMGDRTAECSDAATD